jgi:hypothetical protein
MWYALAKDFQTLFGTLVGFAGVCLTLWFNARVADNKRATEIAHDRNTTRVALSSELSVIKRSVEAWKDVLDQVAKEGHVALPRSFDAEGGSRAYRAALPKIGLLTEAEIQQAVLAYSQYESLSKMSHDMQKQINPSQPDEAMSMAFQAYQLALSNTLAAASEALDTITEAHVIERAKKKL